MHVSNVERRGPIFRNLVILVLKIFEILILNSRFSSDFIIIIIIIIIIIDLIWLTT
jgi:hypothetical protein